MIIDEDDYLSHYGILRRSGRYPWGSGGTHSENNRSFLGMVEQMRREGLSEKEIADGFGISTTQLRATKSIVKTEEKQADIAMAQRLKDKGMSNVAIGQRMGIPESSVRALLAPGQRDKADVLQSTVNMLKQQVAEKKYVDIGVGTELHMGISGTKLKTAVAVLKEQGYTVHYVKVEQLGTGKETTITVLAKPDTPYSEVFRNRADIRTVARWSEDGGRTYLGIDTPISVSSKRIKVRYAEEGGADADGVIYVRPGVKDLSMGTARYAQVRVAVDGTHYLKGMAIYKDDLPDGVDLVFNTNKKSTGNKLDAMKKLSDDPDNPFGAIVRQIKTPDGKRVSSAMNIVNDEGNWDKWSRSLSSQFLSKQSPALARAQLDMTFERKKAELDNIMKLTNPEVRKHLLDKYADAVDSSAVHLKAAALPRQENKVILPVNTMKETEVYAPTFRDGERVALVRFPHGGTFEIPELTVNNRHPDAKRLLGNARDAIGIHSKVAQKLSGADFDGDTVLVIPNPHGKVKSSPALEGLKGFDPQRSYPGYPGMPKMTARTKAIQMGDVSNLITDMTIRGASNDELARAVRHSMVVIDAEKHGLNWKQSALDNGIAQLKAKYQGSARGGASTLLSRKKSEKFVPERKERSVAKGGPIDKATGKRVFEVTGRTFVDSQGRTVTRTTKVKKLAETDDASTLSSGTVIEKMYADHSNKLKALANEARRIAVNTKATTYSPSAKTAYSKEVASLNAKLNVALRNAPLERQAQVIGNAIVTQKRHANPDMEPAEIKKLKSLALNEARTRTGAGKKRIEITDSEWAAIQAGAISSNKLNQILANADVESVKKLATPKTEIPMTTAKTQRALQMAASGYTQAEIADALGVSLTTLKTVI